jgi:AraC-like DNA-binding protein
VITVSSFGARTPHQPFFCYARPAGQGAWLMMVFHSGIEIDTEAGRVQGQPGQGIILDPAYPQWHRGDARGYVNDWINLAGADVAAAVAGFALTVNRLLELEDPSVMGRLLDEMHRERLHRARGWEAALDLLARQLLLAFSRHRPATGGDSHAAWRRHHAPLMRLRQRMLGEVSRRWSIPQLARAAGLGEHRFATLYRRFFGLPPMEDLIRARIEEARGLLTRSDDSIDRIAGQCGFQDLPYFTRQFTRRVGLPPGRWRDALGLERS